MRKLASIGVFLISLTVCIALLVVSSDLLERSIPEKTSFIEQWNEDENVSGDVADIVSVEADAIMKDWDGDGAPDGFTLYITFFDDIGYKVEFNDTEYTIRIKIFAAEVVSNHTVVRGELLYDFCCPPIRKKSSLDVSTQQGIEVYLNLSDHEWIIVAVEVEISGVGVFHTEKEAPCL